MSIDLKRLSPAPWECEQASPSNRNNVYAAVKDANGKVVFDSLNSDVAEIHTDYDEDRATYSDEQGRVDLGFAALARNAFEVMMRLLWNTQEFDGHWIVFGRTCPTEVHEWSLQQKHNDPFTALVEADAWYKANVEAKNGTDGN